MTSRPTAGRGADVDQVRSLFRGAAARYDVVVRTATLGMDLLWKRRLLAAVPDDREYRRVLDMACGTGIVTSGLARRFPRAEVVGLDVSPEMLSVARDRNRHGNVRYVEMAAEDVVDLGPDAFDLVTASYLPKYVDVGELASNARAVVSEPGAAVFHDFTYPRTGLYRAGFDAYWGVLSRLLRRVEGYGPISARLRDLVVDASGWPEVLAASLRRAGFDRASVRIQPLEIAAIVATYDEADA